ncbi:hypothetical protein GCM10010975_37200 [Comamonas phosphati]|nr:hypothetical protein GCM10010975_37200 [Comamonas phosphati]
MTRFHKTLTSAAIASALLASLSLPGFAQTTAPAAPTAQAAPQHQHGQGNQADKRAEYSADHMEHMQQRIAKLKTALKLSSAQESAWNTYAAAMKPAERPARMDREAFAKLTTPQRIDKMREMREQRNAEMDRHAEATKAFYAQLTAEQQKTFDAETLRMHHDPRPFHGGGKSGHEHPAPAQ